jgi:hypothetical protein
MRDIGRALGVDHGSIRGVASTARKRAPVALTLAEREDSRGGSLPGHGGCSGVDSGR